MGLREELAEYSERSTALIEESPQMDEQNTKRKVIEPLIELLGWDILSTDVELEYSVQMGAGTKKVDYALKIEGTPVVFVEAKGCDTPLGTSHEDQLTSYMRQVGVDWGLLSNGREFKIFRRDFSTDRPNEISLAKFPIEEIPDNNSPLRALSQDSISSGESRQIAEKIESVQQAVEALRKNKENLSEDVTKVVTEITGNSVSQQVEDEAKSFVDDLTSSLEEQAHRTGVKHRQDSDSSDEGSGEKTDGYAIRILRDGAEVHRVVEDLQSEAIAALVDYLIKEEGLVEAIEIPYVPGTERGNRALLNDEPKHTDGDDMRSYEPVAEGYYLYTSFNAEDKIRYISELPRKVGLESEFTAGWPTR